MDFLDDFTRLYRADETAVVIALRGKIELSAHTRRNIQQTATVLVEKIREQRKTGGGLDAFLHEYDLSSDEGVLLMCLAEAFLRIPDNETADRLIADKIACADWGKHLGKSASVFANASTWALMLTGKMLEREHFGDQPLPEILGALVQKLGEPLLRESVRQGMKILAGQFVMGNTIQEALQRSNTWRKQGYSFSYDMLGEAARTAGDAELYFQAYLSAIGQIGKQAADGGADVRKRPGISIKLSALHPRYEYRQRERILQELLPKLVELSDRARQAHILLTVDAEEAERLELSLELFAALFRHAASQRWDGLGLAVQAYQKRAYPLIEWLEHLAQQQQCPLHVRLVKGAYWDTEIKRCQQQGLSDYPVFTRKLNTDVSYLACAKRLLEAGALIHPQFASHNAQTVASILHMAAPQRAFEFQRLQGMGESLYEPLLGAGGITQRQVFCRIYSPVGNHRDLLPYLIRRLLENGANTSFINRVQDDKLPIASIIEEPLQAVGQLETIRHPAIPLPRDLYQPARSNSIGLDLTDAPTLLQLKDELLRAFPEPYRASSLVCAATEPGEQHEVLNPANHHELVGQAEYARVETVAQVFAVAANHADDWDSTPVETRIKTLQNIATLYEQHRAELVALMVRETGKTLEDALAEVREAVDFCRYYAYRCQQDFAQPITLQGATGESNSLRWHGRGVFACISPWNFPLAIFTGQITAALAAGNAVIAKPAAQSSLTAHFATRLMHQAGVPREVLQLIIGEGSIVGNALVSHPQLGGVAFTGGMQAARHIHNALAQRPGAIIPFIAETGGVNAMIVDSSALTEQVVDDVIRSAFNSAGQRCSALRILYLQDAIAAKTIAMLKGAMQELRIGNPALLQTDIGPVIDPQAKAQLERHLQQVSQTGKLIHQCALPAGCEHGSFFAPCAIEIDNIAQIGGEKFGPILHVCRYAGRNLDQVIAAINQSGYGLTLGIHSRINQTIEHLTARLKVGNIYVNRNQIGAVVGVQPFGGEGLSGTGPKAGGPHYLHRFATERVVSVNTAAQGGDVALLSLRISLYTTHPIPSSPAI
ncbi:MAG: bifunctional proline dehydrogenase/L-glutamate gamma-semialdehyde dehydrogenase PutA [Gammaproteobacteria bacterium]|nr:bifunctional proline dehydrogenase/L-glutamate gamma-semialdehyde dehydrogenase PutA [Gammaproteobacteria bacterium]